MLTSFWSILWTGYLYWIAIILFTICPRALFVQDTFTDQLLPDMSRSIICTGFHHPLHHMSWSIISTEYLYWSASTHFPLCPAASLMQFSVVSEPDVGKSNIASPSKSYTLDLIPTWPLTQYLAQLAPAVTVIGSISLFLLTLHLSLSGLLSHPWRRS